jgi:predicted glycosyltransferase
MKFLLYSHDTFGLGHIRRNLKMANALTRRGHQVLIVCSCPFSYRFKSDPNISLVTLPGFEKSSAGGYRPRQGQWDIESLSYFRKRQLLQVTGSYTPDVFIVDKAPTGVYGELLPTLKYLKTSNTSCRVIMGFRDILDSPDVVKNEWSKGQIIDVLNEYYDNIFVYGQKNVFDFVESYNLPLNLKRKLHYQGYVFNQGHRKNTEHFDYDLCVTLGGGGDGEEDAQALLDWAKQTDRKVFYLSGPYVSDHLALKAGAVARENKNFTWAKFHSKPEEIFTSSRKVITMGGYNSLVELIAMGHRPLVIPRTHPRKEQLIRAKTFGQLGLCSTFEKGLKDLDFDQFLNEDKEKNTFHMNCALESLDNFFNSRADTKKFSSISASL